ncbi:MAG: RNA 2',3'-cyclic phosphodiesterase [archaeon]
MRAFIAVEIGEDQRAKLGKLIGTLKKIGADVKFVEPENLHLTLKFLGEVDENALETARKGCEKAVEKFAGFKMSLKGVGAFPNWDYAKVLWAGVEQGAEELIELQEEIDAQVNVGKIGAMKFSPHVTIGRVKSIGEMEKLLSALRKFENSDFGEVEVKEVKIRKSELAADSPVYSDLASISLNKR